MSHSGIRVAGSEDRDVLRAIYEPVVCDTPVSFELEPPGAREMGERLVRTLTTYPWLVREEEGSVIGYAYAGPFQKRPAYRWSVEVSVYVRETARGRGVGRSLYAPLLDIISRQGFVRAYAGITLPNPASVRLHESIGFVPVGVYRDVGYKLGAWHDVGWWQRPLRAAASQPREPVPFPEFRLAAEEILSGRDS